MSVKRIKLWSHNGFGFNCAGQYKRGSIFTNEIDIQWDIIFAMSIKNYGCKAIKSRIQIVIIRLGKRNQAMTVSNLLNKCNCNISLFGIEMAFVVAVRIIIIINTYHNTMVHKLSYFRIKVNLD